MIGPDFRHFAVGDGTTDDTAKFQNAESRPEDSFHLPRGTFATTLNQSDITKHYSGPGVIKLASGHFISGTRPDALRGKVSGLGNANGFPNSTTARALIVIGDSISVGATATFAESYPAILQRFIGSRLALRQSTFVSGGYIDRDDVPMGGSFTRGYAGPLQGEAASKDASVILAAGGSLTFPAAYSDYICFWYRRAVGAGSIQKSSNGTNTDLVNCAGAAAENVFSGFGTFRRIGAGALAGLTASGGPVEIVGIAAVSQTARNSIPVVIQARGGYATRDYTASTVLDQLVNQAKDLAPSVVPMVIVALGSNDIYGSPAVPVATFRANLTTIATGLIARGAVPILQVPLRSTLTPTSAPFDDYRHAVYRVARAYNLDVCDLSDLDLEARGLMDSDHLHPNALGYQAMAARWLEFLGLGNLEMVEDGGTITLINGATTTAGFATPTATLKQNGTVALKGVLTIGGIAGGTDVAQLPSIAIPAENRMVHGVTAGATGIYRLTVGTTGLINLTEADTVNPGYVSLDGITYSVF